MTGSCKKKVYRVMCEQSDGQRHGRYKGIRYESTKKRGVKPKPKVKKSNPYKDLVVGYFRASGKEISTREEFVMSTSLEHKWMSPSNAKRVFDVLVDKKLIEVRSGFIRPAFRIDKYDLPYGYRPPKTITG